MIWIEGRIIAGIGRKRKKKKIEKTSFHTLTIRIFNLSSIFFCISIVIAVCNRMEVNNDSNPPQENNPPTEEEKNVKKDDKQTSSKNPSGTGINGISEEDDFMDVVCHSLRLSANSRSPMNLLICCDVYRRRRRIRRKKSSKAWRKQSKALVWQIVSHKVCFCWQWRSRTSSEPLCEVQAETIPTPANSWLFALGEWVHQESGHLQEDQVSVRCMWWTTPPTLVGHDERWSHHWEYPWLSSDHRLLGGENRWEKCHHFHHSECRLPGQHRLLCGPGPPGAWRLRPAPLLGIVRSVFVIHRLMQW